MVRPGQSEWRIDRLIDSCRILSYRLMSGMRQKPDVAALLAMSGPPRKADIRQTDCNVRSVPIADIVVRVEIASKQLAYFVGTLANYVRNSRSLLRSSIGLYGLAT